MKHIIRIPVLFVLTAMVCAGLQAAVPEGWTDDFKAAGEKATAEGRPMLVLFTGSDWCIWCKRLYAEILDTDAFKEYAAASLVPVYIDYPRKDYRSKEVARQNQQLDQRYDIEGYPTVVLMDVSGKELARLGYMQGGPKTFIREIERSLKK